MHISDFSLICLCQFPLHIFLLPPFLSPFHSKSNISPLSLSSFHFVPSFLSFRLLFPYLYFIPFSFSFIFVLVLLVPFTGFFSFSLLRFLDINTPAYCSENQSLFVLSRTSFAASSLSFTSIGLILYSSLFPSLINCFCSMFSISITSNIFLQASLSFFINVFCLFFFWFWEIIYFHIFSFAFVHLFYPCIVFLKHSVFCFFFPNFF